MAKKLYTRKAGGSVPPPDAPATPVAVKPPAPRPASALGTPLLTGDIKSKVGQVSGGGLVSQINPELQSRIASQQKDLTDQYQRTVAPSIDRAAEQYGRYGSDAYQLQKGIGAEGLTRALGDVASNMTFQDYNARMQDMMQGLGLGTQMYGIDTQAASQRDAANAAASASAQNTGMQMQMLDKELQFKAAQAMQQGDYQTMQMMLDAASQLGGMQQNALGNLPGIDQMGGMGFLSQLLGQSTGLDTNAIGAILQGQQQQNQFNLGKQGLGIQQQGLNLDQQQQQYLQQLGAMGFMNQNPWDMLNNYGNLVSGLTGQYGTGQGQQSTPYQGPSPFEAGIQGGLGAFNLFGGGNMVGGQQPAPYNPAAANYFRQGGWG